MFRAAGSPSAFSRTSYLGYCISSGLRFFSRTARNIFLGDCFSTDLIFFSPFAGKGALVSVILVVVLGLGLLLLFVLKKLKCNRGNCLVIFHEICFPELGKASTRAVTGFCAALQGTCLSSSSFSMQLNLTSPVK